MYLGGYIWYRHIAQFGMECISAGISCISAPLSHASLHLPALHAAPPYTSSSKAAPSSSSTPTSINFFQPLPDTFLSGKARRSLDRNCFSISNFLQGSARASLDLPRWILWSRSGFAHWRQLPHHCTLVADTDMKWHLPLICNKTTTLAAAFLGQVAIQSSSKFALSQSDPPLIGKVLKELYYGNVITIVVVYDAHIVWLFQLVQTPAFQGERWNSWRRQYNWISWADDWTWSFRKDHRWLLKSGWLSSSDMNPRLKVWYQREPFLAPMSLFDQLGF